MSIDWYKLRQDQNEQMAPYSAKAARVQASDQLVTALRTMHADSGMDSSFTAQNLYKQAGRQLESVLLNHDKGTVLTALELKEIGDTIAPFLPGMSRQEIDNNIKPLIKLTTGIDVDKSGMKAFSDAYDTWNLQKALAKNEKKLAKMDENSPEYAKAAEYSEKLRTSIAKGNMTFRDYGSWGNFFIENGAMTAQMMEQLVYAVGASVATMGAAAVAGGVMGATSGAGFLAGYRNMLSAMKAAGGTITMTAAGNPYVTPAFGLAGAGSKAVLDAGSSSPGAGGLADVSGKLEGLASRVLKPSEGVNGMQLFTSLAMRAKAWELSQSDAGNVMYEMRHLTDDEGNKIPNKVVDIAGTIYGLGIFMIESELMSVVNPIARKMGATSIITPIQDMTETLEATFKTGFLGGLLGYGYRNLAESGQEGVEQAYEVAMTAVAKKISDMMGVTNFNVNAQEEFVKAATEGFKTLKETYPSFLASNIFPGLFNMATDAPGWNIFRERQAKKEAQQLSIVSAKAREDAERIFDEKGVTVHIDRINTGEARYSAPVEEQLKTQMSEGKMDPINVTFDPVSSEMVPVNNEDAVKIETAKVAGLTTGIKVNVMDVGGLDQNINRNAMLELRDHLSTDMQDSIVGTSGEILFVKDQEALDQVKESLDHFDVKYQQARNTLQVVGNNDNGQAYRYNVSIADENTVNLDYTYTPLKERDTTNLTTEEFAEEKRIEDSYNSIKEAVPFVSDAAAYNGAQAMEDLAAITGQSAEEIRSKGLVTILGASDEEVEMRKKEYGMPDEQTVFGWMRTQARDGREVYEIHLTKNTKATTIAHEVAHVIRAMSTAEQLAGFVGLDGFTGEAGAQWRTDIKQTADGRYQLGDQIYDTYKDAVKAAAPNEEKFVELYMLYKKRGIAPNDSVRSTFERMSQFIDAIRMRTEGTLTPEAASALDQLFNTRSEGGQRSLVLEANELMEPGYHGTAADFSEFSLEKIGTGEGAQAFGWGIYITDSAGIGKAYAKADQKRKGGPYINSKAVEEINKRKINEINHIKPLLEQIPDSTEHYELYLETNRILNEELSKGNITRTSFVKNYLTGTMFQTKTDLFNFLDENLKESETELKNIEKYASVKRNLYKVEIPDMDVTHYYLEWDEALDPEETHQLFEELSDWLGIPNISDGYSEIELNNLKGSDVYQEIAMTIERADADAEELTGKPLFDFDEDNYQKLASQFLHNMGYVGIRYEAERNTRGNKPARHYNYVIFDPKDIKITQHWQYDTDSEGADFFESETSEAQRQYDEVVAKYKGTDQWLKAPNGKDTNLTERQWVQVRTQNFLNWFGDWINDPENASKVIDENGEPLVLYHGSNSNKEFDVFDIEKYSGTGNDAGWLGSGAYFAYEEYAQDYNTGSLDLIGVFLNIRNPYYAIGEDKDRLADLNSVDASREFTEELISEGYDGVIFNGDLNMETVAFSPNQIKSTDNNGEFSNENNSILFEQEYQENERHISERVKDDWDMVENEIRQNPEKYYTEDGKLKAPNGKESHLPYDTYVMVRTPAFKAWFGDWESDPENSSKIVDENGEPRIVYHGTPYYGFDTFDTMYDWAWFSETRKFAEGYADTRYNARVAEDVDHEYDDLNKGVYGVFLNIRNPIDIREFYAGDGMNTDEFVAMLNEKTNSNDFSKEMFPSIWESELTPTELYEYWMNNGDFVEKASRKAEMEGRSGYDGIIVKEDSFGDDLTFGLWNPNQIKSVNNNGEFSQSNNSIYFETAAPIESENFKSWFGDWQHDPENASKVVDQDGRPRVVYHGSPNRFDVFDKKKIGSTTDGGWFGRGFYFTDDRERTEFFSDYDFMNDIPGGQIIAAYLNIRKPLDIAVLQDKTKWDSTISEMLTYWYNLAEYLPDDLLDRKMGGAIADAELGLPETQPSTWTLRQFHDLVNQKHEEGSSTPFEDAANELFVNYASIRDNIFDFEGTWNGEGPESVFFAKEITELYNRGLIDGVLNAGAYGDETVVFEPNQVKSVENEGAFSPENDSIYFEVVSKDLAKKLDADEYVKAFRSMQIIDGKLYPPMATFIDGKSQPYETGVWYQADENPGIAYPVTLKNGTVKYKFDLVNGYNITSGVDYNPYFHATSSPFNDQFTGAYNRPNLVLVEVLIPKSDLDSGYRAEKASKSVGETSWHSGTLSAQLKAAGKGERTVYLSRYNKILRIVPNSEVASMMKTMLEGTDFKVPYRTVTESLRNELEKIGVEIDRTDMGKDSVLFESSSKKISDLEAQKAELIKPWKMDIQRALDLGEYVATEYLQYFKDEEWAKEAIAIRELLAEDPELFGNPQEAASFDEWINPEDPKEAAQIAEWIAEREKTDPNVMAYLERVWDNAHLFTPEQQDRVFAQEWTSSDEKMLELAEKLQNYRALSSSRQMKRNPTRVYSSRFGAYKGVSRDVLWLRRNDGTSASGKTYTRSTHEEIEAAKKKVQENPTPYRLAYLQAYGANDAAFKGADYAAEMEYGVKDLNFKLDQVMGTIDEQIANELRRKQLRESGQGYKVTIEDLQAKIKRAEEDLKDLQIDKDVSEKELRAKLDDLQDQYERERDLHDLYKKKVDDLKKDKKADEKAIKSAQERLDKQRVKYQEKKAERDKYKNALDALRRRNEAIAERDSRVKTMNRILKAASFSNSTLDISYETLFAWVRSLFDQVDRSELYQQRKHLMSQISEASASGESERAAELSVQLEDVRQRIKASEEVEVPENARTYFNDAIVQKADNRQSAWTQEELDYLLSRVKLMREDAKAKLEQKLANRNAERARQAEEFFEENYGVRPTGFIREDVKAYPEHDSNTSETAQKAELFFKIANATISRVARYIDGQKEGVAYNLFVRKAWNAQNMEVGNTNMRTEQGVQQMKDLGIKPAQLRKEGYTYTKENGDKVTLTRDQMIGVYVYSKSDVGAQKIMSTLGNGIGREGAIDIISQLTDAEKAWGDYMVYDMSFNAYDRIAQVMENEYNMPMGRRENYFPLVAAGRLTEGEGDLLAGPTQMVVRYTDKGFTKSINPYAVYELDLNVTENWLKQVRRQEHFIAYAAWTREANYLLGRGGMGDVVKQKYGNNYLINLQDYVAFVGSPQSTMDNLDRTLASLIGRYAGSKVIGNVSAMLKQIPTMAAAIGNTGVKEFFGSVVAPKVSLDAFLKANNMLDPDGPGYKTIQEFIFANAPEMKNRRYGSLMFEGMDKIGKSSFDAFRNEMNARIGQYTLNLTDGFVTQRLWLARYMTVMRELEAKATKAGVMFDQNAAHKEAAFKASQLISETQNTAVRMDLSQNLRKAAGGDMFYKSTFLFGSATMNVFNMMAYDIPYLLKNKKLSKAIATAAFVVINIASMMAIGGAFARKKNEDDEEYAKRLAKEAAFQTVGDAIPGWGTTISNAYQGYSGSSTMSLFEDVGSAARKITKAEGWESLSDILSWVAYAGASAAGLPATAGKKVLQSITEMNPGYIINKNFGDWYEENFK